MTKEKFLKQSNGGLDFYRFVIGKLEVHGNKCKNVHNPFYNDSNPSLSIYCNNDRWYYNDFGESETYSGDVFHFASHFYQLDIETEFPQILAMMAKDLKISIERNLRVENSPEKRVPPIFELIERSHEKRDDDFWGPYKITSSVCKHFNIIPLSGYKKFRDNGEWVTHNYESKLAYAIDFGSYAKIYQPNQNPRFFYLGKNDGDYIFGLRQIDHLLNQGKTMDYLIITGGEKDAMTIYSMGFEFVISFNNETPKVPSHFLSKYYSQINHNKIIVLYDIDDHGIKASEQLSSNYGFTNYMLPYKAFENNTKDISEFVAAGGEKIVKEELNSLIIDFQNHPSEALSSEIEVGIDKSAQINVKGNYINEQVFKSFPEAIGNFLLENGERDRDLIYLGLLAISGALFNNVSIRYGKLQTEYPHLFIMVIAPQASGKGILKASAKIMQKAIESIQEKMGGTVHIMIPANSSTASLIENLSINKGVGIIFDTEADTLNTVFKNDWGNYSSYLRQAFHSEEISLARRKNNERIIVEQPKLSVILSGTPNQLSTLIKDKENGLLSRFIYYKFDGEVKWVDQFNIDDKMDEALNKLSEYFERIVQKLAEKETVKVTIQHEQSKLFNQFFEDLTKELSDYLPECGASLSKRLGTIAIKMILTHTIWRLGIANIFPDLITVKKEEVDTVLQIISCLKLHTINAFQLIGSYPSHYNNNLKEQFLYVLPQEFTRNQANKQAELINIKLPTAEKHLNSFLRDGIVERVKHGLYKKRK